ncbi:MAG: type I-B CRISPR-associated protein Cas5 [Halanaerobiaceae bacterium]|nr:type I-B CRISPR-associated protein Cas5 [Halanaerobiaceae bacterium]
MEVLVFDIFGDLGHFKKYYTTSSPLSFSFPPPPTIAGMLSAIAGIDREEYLEVFSPENYKIAIRIKNPIQKWRAGLNIINTKGNNWVPIKKANHGPRSPIKVEFIKKPYYRVYFHHKDRNLFSRVVEFVKDHKSYYTLSLGLSELLADFSFVDLMYFEERKKEDVEVLSVVPLYHVEDIHINSSGDRKYFKEKMPIIMDKDRIVHRYEDVLFEIDGKPVRLNAKRYWEGENSECIMFF